MAKFYAVKVGRNPGIYTNWDKCKEQVDGFSGAVYKSFKSEDAAKDYLTADQTENTEQSQPVEENSNNLIAYVDGSYRDEDQSYSYGVAVYKNDNLIFEESRRFKGAMADMRNVAGEIMGAQCAMQYAMRVGAQSVKLHYDYEGIEKWATGEWKCNKEGTKQYKTFYDSVKSSIHIQFVKVKAHSGVKQNEHVDKLAKNAELID